MPIRIEQDPSEGKRPRKEGGNFFGNLLGKILPLVALFLFRKPKILIPLLLVGAVWYFFFGGKEFFSGKTEADGAPESSGEFSFGAALSEQEYDKAEVFEPLAAYSPLGDSPSGVGGRGGVEGDLPSSISLLNYAPKRQHQGRQGSCVGWASSYAARTILHARATGSNPDHVAFSPSYLYNQIALEGCQGAYMNLAMQTLLKQGDLPFHQFDYTDRDCERKPNSTQTQQAGQFRIKGYNRLSKGGENYKVDLAGVKQHLAQGSPVVVGMLVGGSFMHPMVGKGFWQPTQRDYEARGFTGHAMCAIGYDDQRQAVQIMNSWGQEWGDNGVAWIPYDAFEHFTKEAYGLYPMGDAPKLDPGKLVVKLGLVDNASKTLIPLKAAGERTFRTRAPLRKGNQDGTRFKIAIENSVECYTYVFGQETDGSSYVLFPYTKKHSPYCGITGTRVFPKDHSLFPDDLGDRDYFAIVVSKKPLDWNALNSRISTSRQGDFIGKVREALGQEEVAQVQFSAPDAVEFSCSLAGRNAVGVVIEVEKK